MDNGEEDRGRVPRRADTVRDAYGTARDAIRRLATDQAKTFYDGVTRRHRHAQPEYNASALDTNKLRSTELKQAFDEVPECR